MPGLIESGLSPNNIGCSGRILINITGKCAFLVLRATGHREELRSNGGCGFGTR